MTDRSGSQPPALLWPYRSCTVDADCSSSFTLTMPSTFNVQSRSKQTYKLLTIFFSDRYLIYIVKVNMGIKLQRPMGIARLA